MNLDFINQFEKAIDLMVPGQSIDCVVFGYGGGHLKVLGLKWRMQNRWSLPGGFIFLHEDIDDAALRILNERTGLTQVFLSQFHTFGSVNRRENDSLIEDFKDLGFKDYPKVTQWFSQRFITTGYIALVDIKSCKLVPDFLSEGCEWLNVNDLPKMTYDHANIVSKAQNTLRVQLNYLPLGKELLPTQFTMGELQELYESILGYSLDRGNFQKKMLRLEILDRHEKRMNGKAHKAPYQYSINEDNYENAVKNGIGFL
ncbi:MAG: NUDIX hydrolase [Cyclobacteriaceae bacterium]